MIAKFLILIIRMMIDLKSVVVANLENKRGHVPDSLQQACRWKWKLIDQTTFKEEKKKKREAWWNFHIYCILFSAL